MAARRTGGRDETLADLLVRAQERLKVTGGRALAREAAELGHDVSHTTLNKILAGRSENQSAATLDAVAALAGVARSRAHVAAGRPAPGRPFADELPPEADRLDRRERDAVLGVIRVLLDRDGQDGRSRRSAAPPLKAVARRSTRKGTPRT